MGYQAKIKQLREEIVTTIEEAVKEKKMQKGEKLSIPKGVLSDLLFEKNWKGIYLYGQETF